MPDLSRELRRSLEATVKAAREAAETGAAASLRRLGVDAADLPAHLEPRRAERNRLRAHARSLGDHVAGNGTHDIRLLTEAAAYVQWHRLLFARFLLERGLLRDETGVAVSLTDCREDAAMSGTGDEWSIAAAHAARLLPGVFPPDDPLEALSLAPEHAKALRDHLRGLDSAIFQADDSLGWTYQFWRAAEKKAVNESQVKIGAAELPAVTQLFTEPYMVRFLLHNTLGAWWAGKLLAARPDLAKNAADEAALRTACALPGYAWDFLRFVREDGVWHPAAGVFPGWPAKAAALTVLDPCCGSGHFLTEALSALAALRAAEENLSPAAAVVAVLRDNLAGLEIDGRCVQIAAFALAVTAWRIGGAGTALPTPHVAWVGAPPPLPKAEFAALANGDEELRRGLEALHDLFIRAPLLGSLIEPTGGDLIDARRVARIEDSISLLVERMRGAEPERAEGALAALGMADAAVILSRRWVLQSTNVPFLGRGKQDADLAAHLAVRFATAKADLATAMLERMRRLAAPGGTVAAVTPQNWLFLAGYKKLRECLLAQVSLAVVAALGPRCFETISGEVVNAVLVAATDTRPDAKTVIAGFDANEAPDPAGKAAVLSAGEVRVLGQSGQRTNPDQIIQLRVRTIDTIVGTFAYVRGGTTSGDSPLFRRFFWEVSGSSSAWELQQNSFSSGDIPFVGRECVLLWEAGEGLLASRTGGGGATIAGREAWRRDGLAISYMSDLAVTRYTGEIFENVICVLIPRVPVYLPALLSFCESDEFVGAVRSVNQKLSVDVRYFEKAPFDLAHWQQIATEKYPNGLPEPYSDDPTQWLFHGHPRHADPGTELHVALARLAGYRWPAETDATMRLSDEARARIAEAATLPAADADGLLALVPVLGERPLADRLRAFCAAAWDDAWLPGTEAALIAAACDRTKDKPPRQLTLDAWLRTHAARQHAKLFHERPMLWFITDGRADGFSIVVHYHRLTRTNLERLAWTVLGDWIARLGDDPRAEAARVLQAKLATILEGEAPHDIFVRWKPLDKQPLGWDPDLDDGVRLNIRPASCSSRHQ